jgi:hypothetical protein
MNKQLRTFLAVAKQFPTHNMREFFKRRMTEDVANKTINEQNWKEHLAMIKRCVVLQKMTYDNSKKTVVEGLKEISRK